MENNYLTLVRDGASQPESNYLTLENFDVLINSPYPNKKAKIISDALMKKYSIHNKFLYEYNENKIYVKLESDDIKLQILKIFTLVNMKNHLI